MKTKTLAQQEYSHRQARVKALLASIGAAVEAHATKAAGQPDNWGFAGDIGSVECALQELLEGFGK